MLQEAILFLAFIALNCLWAATKGHAKEHRLIANIANTLTWGAFSVLAFALPLIPLRLFVYVLGALAAIFLGHIIENLVVARHREARYKKLSNALLPFIKFFGIILTPIIWIAIYSARAILKKMGIDTSKAQDITEEEIRQMVNTSGEKGSIDSSEQLMINNIFEFGDKTAADIALHRKIIVAIDVSVSHEEAMDFFVKYGFSRYPVYEGSIDNIIGILYAKDVLRHFLTSKKRGVKINLRNIIKPPYVVLPSKKLNDIFEEMKKTKVHMAIVTDEYGGSMGMLTIEDLIEVIVGNIYDEYDDIESPDIEEMGNGKFKIKGDAHLDDAAKALGIPLPDDEFDTFGGFVVHLLDGIPNDGEKPQVNYEGYNISVHEVKEKHIKTIFAQKMIDEESTDA